MDGRKRERQGVDKEETEQERGKVTGKKRTRPREKKREQQKKTERERGGRVGEKEIAMTDTEEKAEKNVSSQLPVCSGSGAGSCQVSWRMMLQRTV